MRHLALGVVSLAMVGFLGASRLAADEGGKGKVLDIKGTLTESDPPDKGKPHKAHVVKLTAGKTYKIDLISQDFDTYLRLQNAEGKVVAQDDDSGGDLNARILYQVPKDGDYKIIATSYDGKFGAYALTVVEASKSDLLQIRVGKISALGPEEQKEVLDDLKKHLAARGKDLSTADAQMAFRVAMTLDNFRSPLASDVYTEFAKVLAGASDQKIAGFAKMLEGAGRRTGLPGKAIEVKGTKLDGTALDWSKYKGKVVLVDFWATWCGPCIAELPNIKEMYAAYNKRGFDVVGVSIDQDKEAPAKFMEKRELPWVCLHNKPREGMAEYYGIFSIPQAILVDREGKVVSLRARGPELGRLLEKLIGPIETKKDEK